MDKVLPYDGARLIGRAKSAAHALVHAATAWPDRPALDGAEGDEPLTWAEVAERVNRCAAAVASAGLSVGDEVLVLGRPSTVTFLMDLAVQVAGGVSVLVEHGTVDRMPESVSPVLVVRCGDDAPDTPASLRHVQCLEVHREGGQTWQRLLQRGEKALTSDPRRAEGYRDVASDAVSTRLIVRTGDQWSVLTHPHAAWTFQGALPACCGLLSELDVVVVKTTETSGVRAWLMAALESGARLVLDDEPASYKVARSVGGTVVVLGTDGGELLAAEILDRAGSGRVGERALQALAQVREAKRQGRRASPMSQRRAAPAQTLVHFYGPRLRGLIVPGGVSAELGDLLATLEVPTLSCLTHPSTAGLSALEPPPGSAAGVIGRALPFHQLVDDADGVLAIRGQTLALEAAPAARLPQAWHSLGLSLPLSDGLVLRADGEPAAGATDPVPAAEPQSFLDRVVAQQAEATGASADSSPRAASPDTADAAEAAPEPAPEVARLGAKLPQRAVVRANAPAVSDDERLLERRFLRLCPIADALAVTRHDRDGRSVVVVVDPQRLAGWAAESGVPGNGPAEWMASQECLDHLGACLTGINQYLLAPDRVAEFAVADSRTSAGEYHHLRTLRSQTSGAL